MKQTLISISKTIVVTILFALSKAILVKYKPFVFAVTGSVGKTSTKDALYTILSKTSGKRVRKNEKSFNSETGVPLTIIGRPNGWYSISSWLATIWQGIKLVVFTVEYPEILILEVGADKPRDIYNITRWLKPDISIMTKVGRIAVHVEFFDSVEALLKEKSYLLDATKKGGHIILSADDEEVMKAGNGRDASQGVHISTYGIHSQATIRAEKIEIVYGTTGMPTGMKANIVWSNGSHNGAQELHVHGALGNQFIYPNLAALAASYAYGIDPEQGIEALGEHVPSKGRMNILAGIHDSVVLDDTYNSSPDALSEALKALEKISGSQHKRKIAILGDMMELGKYSVDEHVRLGKEAAHVLGANGILIAVGQRAQGFVKGALEAGMNKDHIVSYLKSPEARIYAEHNVSAGDVVLVKASQSIRAEIIVEALLKDTTQASELLVRQEPEWKNKGV